MKRTVRIFRWTMPSWVLVLCLVMVVGASAWALWSMVLHTTFEVAPPPPQLTLASWQCTKNAGAGACSVNGTTGSASFTGLDNTSDWEVTTLATNNTAAPLCASFTLPAAQAGMTMLPKNAGVPIGPGESAPIGVRYDFDGLTPASVLTAVDIVFSVAACP